MTVAIGPGHDEGQQPDLVPGDGAQAAGLAPWRSSEPDTRPAAARLQEWVRHAPAERAPLLGVPAVWFGGEFAHLAHLALQWPVAGTITTAAVMFGVGEHRQRVAGTRPDPGRHDTGEDAAEGAPVPAAYRKPHPHLRGAELAAAAGGVGAWVTMADKLGGAGGPGHLVLLLYLGGAAGGYWWLRTHEAVRAARARREAEALAAEEAAERARKWDERCADWHKLAGRVGIPSPQRSHLLEWKRTPLGETWLINTIGTGSRASSLAGRDLEERIAELGGTLRGDGWPLPPGRVTARAETIAGRLRIFIRSAAEPWAEPIMHPMASGVFNPSAPYADLLNLTSEISDPVVIGVDPERGTPMPLPLYEPAGAQHTMLAGTTGAGKTMVLDTCRMKIAICGNAVFWQINLKKPRAERSWTGVAEGSALRGDDDADARALAIVEFLAGLIGKRTRGSSRSHRPTAEEPLHILIIDELSSAAADPARQAALHVIISAGRECGVGLLLAGQRPVQKEIGGTTIRANANYFVYGAMMSSDRNRGSGSGDGDSGLPDMGSYGEGAKGVFGIARMHAGAGSLLSRGRAWFWGDETAGLERVIAALTEAHVPYRPEPTVASDPQLMKLFEAATGGQLPDDDRFDLETTPGGQTVQGISSVKERLARAQQTASGPPAPGASDAAGPAAPGPPQSQQGGRDTLGPQNQKELQDLLSRPGGTTLRRAGEILGCSHQTVWHQLKPWAARGLVELRGKGAGQHWEWTGRPWLHLVSPARDPATQTGVSASAPPGDPCSDEVLAAAISGLRFGSPAEGGVNLGAAAMYLRSAGASPTVVDEAAGLLRGHLPYVIARGVKAAPGGDEELPPWIARWQWQQPAEVAWDGGQEDPGEDDEEDPGGQPDQDGRAGSVSP